MKEEEISKLSVLEKQQYAQIELKNAKPSEDSKKGVIRELDKLVYKCLRHRNELSEKVGKKLFLPITEFHGDVINREITKISKYANPVESFWKNVESCLRVMKFSWPSSIIGDSELNWKKLFRTINKKRSFISSEQQRSNERHFDWSDPLVREYRVWRCLADFAGIRDFNLPGLVKEYLDFSEAMKQDIKKYRRINKENYKLYNLGLDLHCGGLKTFGTSSNSINNVHQNYNELHHAKKMSENDALTVLTYLDDIQAVDLEYCMFECDPPTLQGNIKHYNWFPLSLDDIIVRVRKMKIEKKKTNVVRRKFADKKASFWKQKESEMGYLIPEHTGGATSRYRYATQHKQRLLIKKEDTVEEIDKVKKGGGWATSERGSRGESKFPSYINTKVKKVENIQYSSEQYSRMFKQMNKARNEFDDIQKEKKFKKGSTEFSKFIVQKRYYEKKQFTKNSKFPFKALEIVKDVLFKKDFKGGSYGPEKMARLGYDKGDLEWDEKRWKEVKQQIVCQFLAFLVKEYDLIEDRDNNVRKIHRSNTRKKLSIGSKYCQTESLKPPKNPSSLL